MTDLAQPTLAPAAAIGAPAGERPRSQLRQGLARLMRNRAAVAGLIVLAAIVLACAVGPVLWHFDPTESDFEAIALAPDAIHPFGTDDLGRDLLARVLDGGRTSLVIGFAGMLAALAIGVLYGAIAGFVGGLAETVMMRAVDILYGLPFLFFVIMLTTVFGRGFLTILIAIAAVSWLTIAVIVRGITLTLKRKEFVEAAVAGGARPFRIVTRHVIPNTLSTVIVYAGLLVPEIILFESVLSFLGLGVQEPNATWGTLLDQGAQQMSVAPWQLAVPGAFVAATLFSLNFVADGLRDAFDPKDR